jgi:ubiquitin carboxyl-terminal hydrolase L3
MAQKWLPLESNPEILTEYATSLGLEPGYAFQDVLAFEDWAIEMVPGPVKAAVFLYPVKLEMQDAAVSSEEQSDSRCHLSATEVQVNGTFFTKQTVGNACGTIALLHALGNNLDICNEASYMQRFVHKTQMMNPEERGKFLEEDTEISTLHRSVETAGQSKPADEEDPESDLHFVAFVEKDAKIFQLDGRKDAAVFCGQLQDGNFLRTLAEYLNETFVKKNRDEILFSLLALAPLPDDQ